MKKKDVIYVLLKIVVNFMDYKRLETYVWHTCNHKCTYCMEYPNMKMVWNKKVTILDVLKKLIKYKKRWYNHVTYLWWEPFIQWVFLDALKIWKKMKFTILVTTNATTLHIKKEAKKYLPYIDELILSVQAIEEKTQKKISRTNVVVKWDKVIENINKYWKWSFFKINIVITKDNLTELYNIVKYLQKKWIKNISLTYPDLDIRYYWKKHLKDFVAPTYTEAFKKVIEIEKICKNNNINLKIVDFPFCVFPKKEIENFINKTDDIGYWNRIKVWSIIEKYEYKFYEMDRKFISPRERKITIKCYKCLYNNLCWWPSINYKKLYWYSEINPIKNE